MSTRLVVIASAPGAAQHRGVAPHPDDPAEPLDRTSSARLRAAIGTLTEGWHAPERAARDTAIALAAATKEESSLAAWWGPDTGEPIDALLARTGAWLAALPDVRAVVIASPPVVRALVVHALGAPPPVFWRLDVAVLSVSVLTRAGVSRASPRASEQGGAATWRVRSISDR